MDKYEYKQKTEQMLELMEEGAYSQAAAIADEIDWKRVRNATMLTNVSDIYEKMKNYPKSYEILNLAFRRAEGSRKIISRLCTLALKTGNADEAIDYYDEFVRVAPKDPNQHILRYKILRAQRAPIEQQIEALEAFKRAEYIEEWAYELAKLYQEAGMTAECLEECDDLILWFSEGKYVYQAMELKMQYKPLTPSQQAKYDRRYEKEVSVTEEIPDVLAAYEMKEEEETSEDVEEELEEKLEKSEEIIQTVSTPKIGSTMKLDEALKSLLNPGAVSEEETSENADATMEIPTEAIAEAADDVDDMGELEDAIEEIESVVDLDLVQELAEEKKQTEAEKPQPVLDEDLEELVPESLEEEDLLPEEVAEELEDEIEEVQEDLEKEDPDQITGQLSIADILAGVEEEAEEFEEEPLEEAEGDTAEEPTGETVLEEPEADAAQAEKEGAMDEKNKQDTPILPPDIQRLIDEIEGNVPAEESMAFEAEEEAADVTEAVVEESEELYVDDLPEEIAEEELPEESEEEYEEEDWPEEEEADEWDDDDADDSEDWDEEAEDWDEAEEDAWEDESEESWEDEEAEENWDDDEEPWDDDDEEPWDEEEEEEYYEEDEIDTAEEVAQHIEEEFKPSMEEEIDDREVFEEEEEEIDILSSTTPLSRKETAKMIATGKTAPLPLDEISDALSMSDTGFIVHGRYDLKSQSGIGTRAGLTDDQKKLFSYFVPVRGMSEQLVDVLEHDKNCTNRQGTSRTGNLLIIGNKGNGKTVLAVDVVKAIQKQRNIRQGKVAIVTGDSLNKKKISDIFNKLYGGALIIEKAGKMNEKTVARLNKAMERETGELLIVLEDQRKPMDRLLSSNREFRRKFNSRLEVPIFINDELVTFGQTYAQENGYQIDEMGILALYSRIDALQREDHAVTIAEVKEVMDDAMDHSQKASAKKLVKRVFGKNTDDSDRIILSENDFNI